MRFKSGDTLTVNITGDMNMDNLVTLTVTENKHEHVTFTYHYHKKVDSRDGSVTYPIHNMKRFIKERQWTVVKYTNIDMLPKELFEL
jgi:hypothetical protein